MRLSLNEEQYENNIVLPKLESLGYQFVSDLELLHMRKSNTEVLIFSEIENFLKNKKVKKEHIAEVILKLKNLKGSDLITANKKFLKYLIEGIKVRDEKNKKYLSIKLFDSKVSNNNFIVTNQFKLASFHPEYLNQYPDLVIYLNGLPISVIELKSPNSNDNDILEKAHRQIKNYQNFLSDLFIYNAFNVISDGNTSKVGTLTSSYSRYAFWRGEDFSSPALNLFTDLFKKENLLQLISKFTFYIDSNPDKKIMAGYHQYYGVNDIAKSIRQSMKLENNDKRGGIFWHTQGSGKSFSMMFLVKQITISNPGTTFVIVTDRNDLDDQLYNSFVAANNYLTHKIVKIKSIKDLKNEMMNKQQDGIYFTTVQKFDESIGELINRDNILVITDEAHRSHNNLAEQLSISKNGDIETKFGFAKNLRTAFPRATFVGFTGTPIESDDRSTSQIFGGVKTKYVLSDAERDGVIVPIKYESRKPELLFDQSELKKLEEEDVLLNKLILKKSSAPNEILKKKNKLIKKLENFISDKDRIRGVAEDFVSHYKSRKDLVNGKVMFVAYNRKIAFEYYKNILKIEPSWKDSVKLIITQGNKQSDPKELLEIAGNSKYRKDLAIEFKKENSKFKIAIVVDMWLTGFDVPSMDAIYLDKPLKMHNLMQSIARTNRVYNNSSKGIVKECGIVVDYIGLWNKLGEALAFYSGTKATESFINKRDLNKLNEDHQYFIENTILKNFLNNVVFNAEQATVDPKYLFNKIDEATNEILSNKQTQNFLSTSKPINKFYQQIASVVNAEQRIIFHYLILIRQRLIKLAISEIDFSSIKEKMLDQLEKAIKYEKTVVIDNFDGNKINLSDIVKFFESKYEGKNKELNAMEKAAAVRQVIKEIRKIDIIMSSKLSSDLRLLMTKYDNSHITYDELMEQLIFINNEALKSYNNSTKDGMDRESRTFFRILNEPLLQSDYDKKKIKEILDELLLIINNDKKVNKQWIFNSKKVMDVKADIKILLRKHKYPPKDVEISIKRIVDQIIETREYHV